MRRLVYLSLLLYIPLLVGLGALNEVVLALLIPLVFFIGAGLLYAPPNPQLEIRRSLSTERAVTGEIVGVELEIVNTGATLEEALIQDILPDGVQVTEGTALILTSLAADESTTLTYQIKTERGYYRFQHVRVRVRDSLGLYERSVEVSAPRQLLVLPALQRLRRFDIRPRKTRVYSGQIPSRRGGPGVEFFGVREYQPGDPLRWLNARATARHSRTLYINVFEQDNTADVQIVLDARRRSDVHWEGGSLFDHSVSAAATLTDIMIQQGNRVGMLVYGGNFLKWTVPGYGKVQRERILRTLADAEQGRHLVFEDLEYLPTDYFPPGSQLILISPLLSRDLRMLVALQRSGFPLLIISPNPNSVEQALLGSHPSVQLAARVANLERQLLLRNLRRAAVQVLDWDIETPFHHAAGTARSRSLPVAYHR